MLLGHRLHAAAEAKQAVFAALYHRQTLPSASSGSQTEPAGQNEAQSIARAHVSGGRKNCFLRLANPKRVEGDSAWLQVIYFCVRDPSLHALSNTGTMANALGAFRHADWLPGTEIASTSSRCLQGPRLRGHEHPRVREPLQCPHSPPQQQQRVRQHDVVCCALSNASAIGAVLQAPGADCDQVCCGTLTWSTPTHAMHSCESHSNAEPASSHLCISMR